MTSIAFERRIVAGRTAEYREGGVEKRQSAQ